MSSGRALERSYSPHPFLEKLREKIQKIATLARETLLNTETIQKWLYDQKVQLRSSPQANSCSSNMLMVKWQGLYHMLSKVGEVDYVIQLPRKGPKLFHVSWLKA